MTIYDKNGDAFLEITPDDTSYRHREVMGDDTLVLKFSSPVHVEIPVGATCEFGGETYTLARPEALTMRHSRDFEYTVTMEGPQYRAGMWKMRDLTDGRLRFPLTAKPSEHLKLLIDNLNDREGAEVWSAGGCIDGAEACVSYDHVYCREALDLMAEAFGTEWEVDGAAHTVSLGKVEHGRDEPIDLSYGRGNGFLPDVGRSNSSDSAPCEILYAQGGSDNIDASKYPQELHKSGDRGDGSGDYGGDGTGDGQNNNSSVLLLPPGRVIGYDGEEFHYEGEDGWDGKEVRHYVVDEKGYSIRRSDKGLDTMAEDSLDCSGIYPKRVGTVAEVLEVENADGDVPFYDFTDPEVDFDYNDYMVGTGPLTVIFQSGNLAGREFDVTYVHEAEGGKEARRFEVSQQEVDGVIMPQGPGEAFGINPGDTYAVFGCMLPDEYICHDGDHSGAEWDMLRECAAHMYDHEQENHTITGKVDAIWAKDKWEDIGARVRPGGFVRFHDGQWQQEMLLIRITGVKDYLNSPCSPELELSNETRNMGMMVAVKTALSRGVELEAGIEAAVQKGERAVSAMEAEVVTLVDGEVSAAVDSAVADARADLERYTDEAVSAAKSELEGSISKVESDLTDSISKVESDLNTSISKVESDLNTSISKVSDKADSLASDLEDVQGAVSDMRGEVASLGQDIAAAKADMEAYTDAAVAEAAEIREAEVSGLSARLEALYGTVGGIADVLNGTEDTDGLIGIVGKLQSAVATLNEAVAELDKGFEGGDTGGDTGTVIPPETTTCTLTVNVTDGSGSPVTARITVETKGVIYVAMGASAEFVLDAGTGVAVTVGADGYRTYSQNITVTGDMTLEVALTKEESV